jgi:hypothetical protein
MFVSDHVLSAFPVPYIRIVNPWKVIQLHGPQWQSAGHGG